jgi:hypothetical protein
MNKKNTDVKSRIYGRICASDPQAVWSIGDFTDFGPRGAISKALQRLETAGSLRRVDPGLYDRPRKNRLTGYARGLHSPRFNDLAILFDEPADIWIIEKVEHKLRRSTEPNALWSNNDRAID